MANLFLKISLARTADKGSLSRVESLLAFSFEIKFDISIAKESLGFRQLVSQRALREPLEELDDHRLRLAHRGGEASGNFEEGRHRRVRGPIFQLGENQIRIGSFLCKRASLLSNRAETMQQGSTRRRK